MKRPPMSVALSTPTGPPMTGARALGAAGVLGGVVLLVAFLIDVRPDLNWIRLVLFNVGAIAVGIAYARRAPSRAAVVLTASALILANAAHLGTTVLSLGVERPFAGTLGFVGFLIAAAMWVFDAAFGAVVASRRETTAGTVGRLAAVALAVGSLLAITGMDRLGLVGLDHPTIFNTLALFGIFLNGLAWIMLGLDVALGRRLVAPGNNTTRSPEPIRAKG